MRDVREIRETKAMSQELGTCDKKQYEHSGPHERVFQHEQSLPPFACQNWKPIAAAVHPATPEVPGFRAVHGGTRSPSRSRSGSAEGS